MLYAAGIRLGPLCEGAVSYGGIAAEIGAKNMPPACFLNAPTGGKNLGLLFSPSVTAYAVPPPSQREAIK